MPLKLTLYISPFFCWGSVHTDAAQWEIVNFSLESNDTNEPIDTRIILSLAHEMKICYWRWHFRLERWLNDPDIRVNWADSKNGKWELFYTERKSKREEHRRRFWNCKHVCMYQYWMQSYCLTKYVWKWVKEISIAIKSTHKKMKKNNWELVQRWQHYTRGPGRALVISRRRYKKLFWALHVCNYM